MTEGNAVTATELDRDEVDDDVFLEGPVTFFDSGSFELDILDQPIMQAPGVVYEDEDDNAVSAGVFFGLLDLGDVVKAKDEDAVSLDTLGPVDEISLEDDRS